MIAGLITLVLALIVAFMPELVWILAVFPGLYIILSLVQVFVLKAPKLSSDLHLTQREKDAWKNYHIFIRYPMAATSKAGGLSMMQFTLSLLGIVLAIRGYYYALLICSAWFICGSMTPRLNPKSTVLPAAEKGNTFAIEEKEALISLMGKLRD